MAWDTEFVLEGMWTHGEPLNIWEMELYRSPAGYGQLPYQRIHMRIDDNKYLFDRIMGSIKQVFPRLIFITTKAKKENIIYRAEIYSIERKYVPVKYTYRGHWEGLTLGSGLVDQSQKMTVAASAIAEKKTVGHRS